MNKNNVVTILEDCDISVQADVKIAEYTSFNIGGEVKFLAKPKNMSEVIFCLNVAVDQHLDYYFLGKGSNMLISDKGYNGMIILTENLNKITVSGNIIECYAGVSVAKLCSEALSHSLSGLEFAWGIPGSVGGGIYMNAGAYGGEFKDVLVSVKYIDENNTLKTIAKNELNMSYRHSFFSNKKLFIISAKFELVSLEKELINAKMNDYINRRTTKQPLEYPSCGSTFKRPHIGYASALIEECGLKGYSIGGACVSTKHAGFIINIGNATCNDVLNLIAHIKKIVFEKKGIELTCEVQCLGE